MTKVARTIAENGSGPQGQKSGCELAALGRGVAALIARLPELDAVILGPQSPAQVQAKAAYLETNDRIEAIEDFASHMRGQSIEGAMFSIMLAYADVASIAAMSDGDNDEYLRRIKRNLHSAVRALEAVSGVDAEEIGGRFYMDPALDPAFLVPLAAAAPGAR